MKGFIKITGLVLVVLSLSTSCTEQLELTPVSSITASGFWVNEDNANGALNGMYVRFRDQAASNLFYWGEVRGETLSYGLQASEGRERYFENTLDPNFSGPNWLRMYTIIHDANLILKYVPEITFNNPDNKNRMLAQAFSMRAFLYFVMVRTWGGVPLVTDPTEGYDAETTFKPRASADEILSQIKSDLDQAIALFPDNNLPTSKAFWSKPAAQVLKGEVYLWTGKKTGGGQQDFNTALAALNDAATAPGLALRTNFDDIFRYNQKGNSEVLFSVRFLDLESGTNYNAELYVRDDQIPVGTDQATRALIGQGGGLNRMAPSALVRNAFQEDDQRKNATYVAINIPDAQGNPEYYASIVMKYRGFIDPSGRRFIDDIIIYRYADLLLLIAEAKNALGQDPTTEINQVRQRAYGTVFEAHRFVSGSQAANDEAI
ncbi:MAG: RagB/SusD family nutrient uptake outer membrane protein, partial [Saprospiraceae bacterium]|nr:RagB/SusD family nutrient uptake outer membrane protein [Saprospiraceae bacterium]